VSATATAPAAAPAPEVAVEAVTIERDGWLRWLTSTDHKRIGVLYLYTTFVFFLLGGVEALLLRIQLGQAESTFLEPERFNQLFTLHGTTMLFLFVVPVMAGFANYLLPLMIGARGLAFPRLAAWSYWMLLFGGVALYGSVFFNPPEAGFTVFAPLSDDAFLPNAGVDAWVIALLMISLASLGSAINFIATLHHMRAPGMTWSRLPLFGWAVAAYSYVTLIATPVFLAALAMLLIDRKFDGAFFDPGQGGSAMLWQHLFWFYAHPAIYVLVLPAFGIVSEVLPVFARKPIFGYRAMVWATVSIASLGLLTWGSHMFAMPLNDTLRTIFTITALLAAVPAIVQICHWVATLWSGTIEARTALHFAAGMVSMLAIGIISGVFLAIFPVAWQLGDTYFLVAHLHYVLFGGAVLGVFAGLYYWFPKMSGRMLSEGLGKASFWTMLVGLNVTFLIGHSAGLSGMPRRIYEYPESAGWEGYNLISTIGSFVLALGIALTVWNVVRSVRRGSPAPPDPWHGNTLEWFTSSPPPLHNFDAIPVVSSAEPLADIRRALEGDGRAGA